MVNYQSNPETQNLTPDELMGGTSTINVNELIETVIDSLDQTDSAMVSHNESGNIWKFKYGSVEVFVQLTGTSDEDTFTVWSTVLNLPAKNEPQLMRKLLEMNWMATFEAHFAIFNNQIVILSSRTVAELSPGEISRLITVVATIADENDDALIAEFGAA
jgi:Putative bacterial sensory transduction regulator